MSQQRFYDFDGFRVDAEERVLLRDGEILPLTQKAFDVLFLLVQRHGRIVTKEDLLTEIWPDTIVEEGNLAQNIYRLRKILGESSGGEDYIKTVPRRGYRFSAEVTVSGASELKTSAASVPPTISAENSGNGFHSPDNQIVATLAPAHSLPMDSSNNEVAAPASPETQPPHAQVAAKNRHFRIIAITGALIIGAVAWLLYQAASRPLPLSNITINSLTTAGNIQCVALSPDGRLAVYGVGEKSNLSSLVVTQLATSVTQTILQPEAVRYHALTVSPDSSYVYAVRVQNGVGNRTLFRVPLLGRTATKLLDNVETAVAFSPDGKQLAFRRSDDSHRESLLIIANVDGTSERELAALKYPDGFGDPAWSSDGKIIACSAGNVEGGKNKYVVAVRTDNGAMQTILPEKWHRTGQMAWLPGSPRLVMIGNREPADPIQIWQLDYVTGETRRITNDSNSYNRLSISADGRVIAALDARQITSFWTAPADDLSRAQQITYGAGRYRGRHSWTPDGRLVFDSEIGGRTSISVMNADGSNQQILTDQTGKAAVTGYAIATADGRYILYHSDQTGERQIWRMNIDGLNPKQLTRGRGADHPSPTPDSRWVVFTQQEKAGDGKPTIWKVPIDGGEPVQLTRDYTTLPSVSPDGKMVACLYSQGPDKSQIAIYSFADGQQLKVFPQKDIGSPYVRWSPDGKSLVYAENPIGAAKLWKQPIAGGPPQELLTLGTEFIYGFDWSRDGRQLSFVRGLWAGNVMIIREAD